MQLAGEGVFVTLHRQIGYNTIIKFCQAFTWAQKMLIFLPLILAQ